MQMLQQTALHSWHAQHGAKLVPFAGFDMPLHYGSQLDEHQMVRKKAGLFDVSHMQLTHLAGDNVTEMLRYLLSQDVAALAANQASYGCLLNARGGIIDDVIVYRLAENQYWMVSNAATKTKVMPWLKQHAENFSVTLASLDDYSLIAIQGPEAIEKTAALFDGVRDIPPFGFLTTDDGLMLARTGYTGEDGFEIMAPHARITAIWQQFLELGAKPCGLGARDTLRLEAGLNLYGQDMDENTTPLSSGLSFALHWTDRDFMGRDVLTAMKKENDFWLRKGLILHHGGILRPGMKVMGDFGESKVLSGSYSPTLSASIALVRLPQGTEQGIHVVIRNKSIPVEVVRPPFYRRVPSL